jgi:DNA-binding transcriptional MerR regulator
MSELTASYTLNELCVLADLPVRTLRYYVQNGLIDRPDGETRAARYGATHLEQALLVRKWTAAGVSLERVKELLHGETPAVPAKPKVAGSIEVCSHLVVADGLEMVIEPTRAGLTPEQVRKFVKGVMALYADIASTEEAQSRAKD